MTEDRSRETAEEGIDSKSTLPLDVVFRALADRRRRTVLYYLTDCTHPIPLKELVDEIAAKESGMHAGDVPAEMYQRVALDLHHAQLPKLVEWGIVEYDRNLKLIALAETLRPLDEYLHLAKQHDRQPVEVID